MYRLTLWPHETDLMTHTRLPYSRRLVSGGGERGGDEGRSGSAAEMRPKERDKSFLGAWFSVVFCSLEGRGGLRGASGVDRIDSSIL